MKSTSGTIAGVDVGGTFTDLVLLDRDHRVHLGKTPTTPDNQAFGVIDALTAATDDIGGIDVIVHGTTTTTNAVLERKLAKTGLITTAGFRDILELGRRTRPQPYGMTGTFRPIIPRDLRLEVPERLDAAGNVLTPLDETAVRQAVQALLAMDCQSLVIHFLHAYANPAHERRAAEIAAAIWPNGCITMGHALLSEYREYERGVTAAVNASVQPILHRYLDRLQSELAAKGFSRDLLVVNGNGGMVSARSAPDEAAKTVMSGPASGVMAAAYTATRAGFRDIITYDMGGTSSDVAVVRNGVPAVSHELEIEYAMPVHLPMVDVRTIGSGGGSIAWIDDAGLLKVGPESAGADPGPICYGRGGRRPTISDANLALGRLNPKTLLSVDGDVALDDIRAIIGEVIATPLGLDVDAGAGAILTIANAKMAGAIRMVSVSKGLDPRDFALFAFGGAGPLHATALAAELAIPKVLIPARPGITNALGCVVADVRKDFVNTLNRPLDAVDMADVQGILKNQIDEGRGLIEAEPIDIERIDIMHSADMQFIGQTHLLTVSLPSADIDRPSLQALFEEAYLQRFHVELPEIRANLVNLNTTVIGRRPELDIADLIAREARASELGEALSERRSVWFDGGWVETPIYRRDRLPIDAAFAGPAIIEQMDTTIVVEPRQHVGSDADGNLIIAVSGA
ncbi:MAG: hydantoinase/oxoprolinase family protein [Alphaproteobacteria bacterium]|nr:hydantoinase/oxoprolinase family protein [Alphaproteobacteria bacterium]